MKVSLPFRQPLQPLGIDPRRFHVVHRDLGRAGGRGTPGAARVAEHLRLGAGEILQVLELVLPASPPKPDQAVLDIGRVARLRHLAVADHGDPGLHLARDHLAVAHPRSPRPASPARPPRRLRARTSASSSSSGRGRLPVCVVAKPLMKALRVRSLAPSTIAAIFAFATSRGRYLSPQSGATTIFSAGDMRQCIPDPLGDQLRRFDRVSRQIEHAEDDRLAGQGLQDLAIEIGLSGFERDLVERGRGQFGQEIIALPDAHG